MKFNKKNNKRYIHRINYDIYAKNVRLTNSKGEFLGIKTLEEALLYSENEGLDLVEISPNVVPPVCKIMNYGKFLYNKTKSLKEQKKKQKIIHIKEIKFRPNTGEGDYKVKLNRLIKFLKFGNKVKITIRFRGREMAHQNIGIEMLKRLKNDLKEISLLEFFPYKVEGRQMMMVLSPKK